MQRPIPATRSLPRAEAKAALSRIREHLKHQGFTRSPYAMCAEIDTYGQGFAVYVGFQPDADLTKALTALASAAKKPSNNPLSWGFSAMTHSM
jgi:hypothetical protein